MLTSIRIQNFRSIRDAQVKLGQVNLFIGPNNSGKSNFLKGIEFAADSITLGKDINQNTLKKVLSKNPIKFIEKEQYDASITIEKVYIKFNLLFDYKIKGLGLSNSVVISTNGNLDLNSDLFLLNKEDRIWYNLTNGERADANRASQYAAKNILADTIVYKPDPAKFIKNSDLFYVEKPDANLANIIPFLFDLSQNHIKLFNKLNKDFASCVSTLDRVSTPAEKSERGVLKLRFFDSNDVAYDAEDVSEGVLYFLALLCIIHQPYPPRLVLLEEPEKGIHPRRIKEVIDFIFDLARQRDIQIIITSHSPYVVDHFANIPECISVFDRENDETVIHNAADLIEKTNKEYAAQGLPPTKYKDSLGEYWVSGFLGGVPL